MSHNSNDVGRSASRHRPALIAIAVALLVAFLAFVVFRPGVDEQNDGLATTPPPAGTPTTTAEGTDGTAPPVVSPEGLPAPASESVRGTEAAPETADVPPAAQDAPPASQ